MEGGSIFDNDRYLYLVSWENLYQSLIDMCQHALQTQHEMLASESEDVRRLDVRN